MKINMTPEQLEEEIVLCLQKDMFALECVEQIGKCIELLGSLGIKIDEEEHLFSAMNALQIEWVTVKKRIAKRDKKKAAALRKEARRARPQLVK